LRKLSAGRGFAYWIISEFEWKSTGMEPLDGDITTGHDATLDDDNDDDETPQWNKIEHLVGKLNLEITLTKRLPPSMRNTAMERNAMPNGGSLTDDAFRPKNFTVRIEQGSFALPAEVLHNAKPLGTRWKTRLVFDPSPYPPASEWKRTVWNRTSGHWFWDDKEFVGRSPVMEGIIAQHSTFKPTTFF
jgi:hypothetical protein